MDRRNFMGLGILAGLTAGATLATRKILHAQEAPAPMAAQLYDGKFYLFINASGGWDPTMVCDPKGGTINMGFTADRIGRAGNLSYAPVTYGNEGGYTNQTFFEKYHERLLVLNGVDMSTNNHDSGTRFTWSGHLEDGYPPLAALIAASLAPGSPLAFLSNGGYEYTAGIVPLTRVNSVDTVSRIAFPNRPDPNNSRDENNRFLSDATIARIQRHQQDRLAAMAGRQTLPVYRDSMRQLFATRTGGNLLERLMQFIPSNDELNRAQNPIYRQGLVALAGYRAGLTAAANLDTGGFDTHGDHDNQQANALGRLLRGVDLLMTKVDELGLREKVVVMIGSDFGRTPAYNDQRGKDHWSVTSYLMMGPGIQGNRVLGATDAGQRARGFDFGTLQVSDSSDKRLNPKSIHQALRRFANIHESESSRLFPIYGDTVSIFS